MESSSSDLVVDLLNDYLDGVTGVVFAHGGTVVKIVGDSLHAIFGAPANHPDHAAQAVACALVIEEFATGFQVEMKAKCIDLGSTRIGVNSGAEVIGNFGRANFFDYTAYGNVVSIAARQEQANKIIRSRICVGLNTVDLIPGFNGRVIGNLLLKGKSASFRCYEPLTGYENATAGHDKTFALLETRHAKAKHAFAVIKSKYVI